MTSRDVDPTAKGEALLKRWWDIKQKIRELQKEDTLLRDKFKEYLSSRGKSSIRFKDFQITYKEMSRESLSKKNCPPEVWKKYCTTSKYPIVRLVYLDTVAVEDLE